MALTDDTQTTEKTEPAPVDDPRVPSVNEEPNAPTEADENAGTEEGWVDPLFAEMYPEHLSDEIPIESDEPTQEQLDDLARREAETRKAEADAKGQDDTSDDDSAEEATTDEETSEGEGGDGKKPRRTPRKPTERSRSYALQRENDQLKAELDQLKAKTTPEPATPAPDETAADGETDTGAAPAEADQPAPRPKLEDFNLEDYDWDSDARMEAWAEAVGNWTEDRVAAADRRVQEAQEADRRAAEQEQHAKRLEQFRDREAAFMDAQEDYRELVYSEDTIIPTNLGALLVDSEVGPEVAYHLANNQEDAIRLAKLDDVAAAREFGRIESQFLNGAPAPDAASEQDEEAKPAQEAGGDSPAPSARRTVTQAPEPPTTLRGGAETDRNPERMNNDEYRAWRQRNSGGGARP